MKRSREEYRNKVLRRGEEELKLMEREAWKRLLRIDERRWKRIQPKSEEVWILKREAQAHALGYGGHSEQSFHWHKHSKGTGGRSAKTPDEMTEGLKLADALVDLLEDANSTDEAIREKIDALQKVRDNARKQLPKAKQELANVLTTSRQEAVFLLTGSID